MGTRKNELDYREKPRSGVVLSDPARELAQQLQKPIISVTLFESLVKCIEFIFLFLITLLLFHNLAEHDLLPTIIIAILVSSSFITSQSFLKGYRVNTFLNLKHFCRHVPLALLIAFTITLSSYFILFLPVLNLAICLLGAIITAAIFILVFRYMISKLAAHWRKIGCLERRAVLIGGGEDAEAFLTRLQENRNSDIRICGIFDDRIEGRVPEVVEGRPHLGTIDELIEFARIAKLDMLIMTMPVSAQVRMLDLLKKLWVLPIDIRIAVQAEDTFFRAKSRTVIENIPMIDIAPKPLAEWDAIIKRTFDIVFSLVGLCAFSPLMLLTAILISLDSKGPILFRQKRFGFNNEVVTVLKFRSMYHEMSDPKASKVVTKNDPRVTRVGTFIRRTSIDELPQLWNVLKGNLSLVGPRPHAVFAHTKNALWDEVVDGYYARHRVKPGVTGWAQINGLRGEIDTAEKLRKRVEHDLYYIENWSFSFDLYITFMTPIKLFSSENSY